MRFKPMLSGKADLEKVKFPVLASHKLDGVRVIVKDGVVWSRNFKPIPNKHVQELFGRPECEGFDGELIVGLETADTVFQATTSGVMSQSGTPDVVFHVFDCIDTDAGFAERFDRVKSRTARLKDVVAVPHIIIDNIKDLEDYEEYNVRRGYEGIMLRDPAGKYKHGRSTTKEGGLLKVKRFEDAEAVVVDVVELLSNQNEQELDNLGRTVRSSRKEGMKPTGKLGAIIVESKEFGRFSIGSGFTDTARRDLWKRRDALKGKLAKFKYQPSGVKEKPRFPVFLGFRNKIDK